MRAIKQRARWAWWDIRFGYLRTVENLTMGAARRLPKRLRYWVVINAVNAAWAAAGDKTPDEISSIAILNEMYPPQAIVETSQGEVPAADPPPTAYSTQTGGFWPHDEP